VLTVKHLQWKTMGLPFKSDIYAILVC